MFHSLDVANLDGEGLAFDPKLDPGPSLETRVMSVGADADVGEEDNHLRIKGSLAELRRCGASLSR